MRSFAIALITAALATFTNAAPVASGDLSSNPVSNLVSSGSAVSGVKSATNDVHSRDLNGLTSTVGGVGHQTRTDTPSVAVIFAELTAEIQPHIEELTWLDASNATVSVITDIVADVKASIEVAVPRLKALVGADASVILAGSDGKELTVVEIAAIVGIDLRLIFEAVAEVRAVVDVDIAAKVDAVFVDLGADVTALVQAVVDVVAGLSLTAEVKPVEDVILDLHLDVLAKLCGLEA